MNLDWILNPLVAYTLIAAALALCVAVYVSNKGEVHQLRRASDASQNELKRQIEQMQSAVAGIHQARQATTAEAVPVRTTTVRPSLNLTKRTQALRMRRRGESVESIAAALATPRNEIELLLKVYEMLEYRRQLKPAQPGAEGAGSLNRRPLPYGRGSVTA